MLKIIYQEKKNSKEGLINLILLKNDIKRLDEITSRKLHPLY